MQTSDWVNVARCNRQRMMQDRIYTFKDTILHDRFVEVWLTTRAALELAAKASNQ